MVLREVMFIFSDLASKIRAFAHSACNGETCIETGASAQIVLLVLCMKFDILRHSNEMSECLDCSCSIVFLCIFET
jgi:hypothetical protein